MVDRINQINGDNSFLLNLPELDQVKPKLTELEKRFAYFYVLDPKRNGSAAVLRAGYDCAKDSAYVQASRMLRKDKIQAAIELIKEKLGGDDCLGRVKAVLMAQIFTNLSDVMRWDKHGKTYLVPSEQLPPEVAAAIAGIEEVQEESQRRLFEDDVDLQIKNIRRKVKLYDKNKAIEQMAKIMGWYAPEKKEIEGGLMISMLEAARGRAVENSAGVIID